MRDDVERKYLLGSQELDQRRAYDAKFKLKAVSYAKKHGNYSAGRMFGINESCVRRWRQLEQALAASKPTRRAFRGSKSGRYPTLEVTLLEYVQDKLKLRLKISRKAVRKKALEIAKACDISRRNFSASEGWCERFFQRHGISLRKRRSRSSRSPKLCPKSPAE
ncbi:hypothetical protein PR048_007583 [Dryococelus australis]|uniref:HTH CENPB-type domain-containing protein n=1 Tax=Dryococelus australis TaxID=614101 RepID=A0ABQ9HVI7_9NEOP|nr:hypothetical protein PR048_007583 [Dryococelus australis]